MMLMISSSTTGLRPKAFNLSVVGCLVMMAVLLGFTAVTVLAQDTILYEDPTGRFSVPIPPNWTDESTAEIGRFDGADGITVSILAIEAADADSGDQSVLAALAPDLVGTPAAQTFIAPLPNGTWTQSVYTPTPDRFAVLMTQWVDSVTFALLFNTPGQDAFTANQVQVESIILGFSPLMSVCRAIHKSQGGRYHEYRASVATVAQRPRALSLVQRRLASQWFGLRPAPTSAGW
jgi:hypothetical protein